MGVIIAGAGHYLPDTIRTNDFFVKKNPLYEVTRSGEYINPVMTSDEWIQEMMGPKERRVAPEEMSVHEMGAIALRRALERARINASELELLVFATVTENPQFPSAACSTQAMIGAQNIGYAFDIGAACAGFTSALAAASAMMSFYNIKVGAVIGAEKLSSMIDLKDKNCPLFGDGAGAVVLQRTAEQDRGIMLVKAKSNPHEGRKDWIYREQKERDGKRYIRMPCGNEVLKEANRELVGISEHLLGHYTSAGRKWQEKLDVAIFHQANIRILHGVKKRLRLRDEQVPMNIDRYGNMSCASVAVTLSEAYEQGRIREGSHVLMACIGSGMVTSAVGFVA